MTETYGHIQTHQFRVSCWGVYDAQWRISRHAQTHFDVTESPVMKNLFIASVCVASNSNPVHIHVCLENTCPVAVAMARS